MRSLRLFVAITLALAGLGLLAVVMAAPATLGPGNTIVPLGAAQSNLRAAYRAGLSHLYSGGRVHLAASAYTGTPTIQPGDLLLPPGETWDCTPYGGCDSTTLSSTIPFSRVYALRAGGVAVLRSTVIVEQGGGQFVAAWELSQVRQFLDGYLWGSLPYVVLDEAAVAGGGLEGMDLLIIPAVRADAMLTVTQALSDTGALAAIRSFVEAGGTLYAQSNGAYVVETAGLLPEGTVDLEAIIELDAGSEPNRGRLAIQIPDSPLAWSWLTDTLYILTDPLLHPSAEMEVVATLGNADDAPAIVRAEAGEGQIILVAGHPTDEARRLEAPIFMDAVLLALASRAELTGDAIQTWNPAHDPHEFPAYEVVPVSVTLTAANLWDEPINDVVVTETVAGGYTVLPATVSPVPTALYTVTAPTTQTIIVWNLGMMTGGAEIGLSYLAKSAPDALAAGVGVFSAGVMRYDDPELGLTEVSHPPFVLTSSMAARLVGDRNLEHDRHYRIPSKGIYLDVALSLENKEHSLAPTVVVTDWVYLIHPIVDVENQHVILNTNDGETIWMRNEPFLWNNENYPLPVGETSPTRTYRLDDWQGDWCVFTSTHGIHTDPPLGLRAMEEDYGSFVTIPPTYTNYISVTADHELLLPCLPLVFDLGPWPGYWYEEPAIRYGVHSRELFSRTIVFHGTPRSEPDVVVIPNDGGSVYVAAGAIPVPFREHLDAAVPYAAAAPGLSGVAYQDVWSRTHSLSFRGAFYDVWDWDTCPTCDSGGGAGGGERHAGFNLTFELFADLDGNGIPETPVREIPSRLPRTWVTFMGKSYNLGTGIPADQNLADLPVFHGLGVIIGPENGSWHDSWRSPLGYSQLVSVTETAAYDHLLFQQNVPPGVAETFYVSGTISTYGGLNREGMIKLHDGVGFIYRQMFAGPNSYEIYNSHVHSVIGLSSDGQVDGWVGPTAVGVYGDSIYFIYAVDDRYDPRTFTQDPYMNSWGYGDFVATVYVGGREEKTLFRSILTSHDRTEARISLDNNVGVTLTNVDVTIPTPGWITITQRYTDADTIPEPIWPELAYLDLDTIPDAWRGVYYFDLEIGEIPADALGSVITLPVQVSADGLPADYTAPPLVLALRDAAGNPPELTFGVAQDLVLTETLPANVMVHGAALVNADQRAALVNATDFDALHPLSDTAATLFATFTRTLPFAIANGKVAFDLPEEQRTLPPSTTLFVVARATITRAHHGPNQVGDGGVICYTDSFGLRWCDQSEPLIVEASGAAVSANYFCEGGSEDVLADGAGHCAVPLGRTSVITLRITAHNEGDALAHGVTTTPELPVDVTPVGGLGPLVFGDVAPGGWTSKRIALQVAPSSGVAGEELAGWRLPVIDRTWGQFFDTASLQTVSGQFGDAYTVGVYEKPFYVYLPTMFRNYDARPDLIVSQVVVDPADPAATSVVIANQGNSTARNFWVDLYLDPSAPPSVNQPWPYLTCYGGTWFVDELEARKSLVLTVGDTFYRALYSQWPEGAYPAGNHEVWAYADSWGHPVMWAAVNEADEGNNRYGPVTFTAIGGAGAMGLETRSVIPPRPSWPVEARP